tara:strand:+ start:800 stop:1063 length:264 start_codon:yes stop_codon:yes gene_type:complete
MLTKDQILEESKYFLGTDNKLLKNKYVKRRDLIDFLVKKGLFSSFEERSCLKRELKKRKIKFSKDINQKDLVDLALKKKLNFNEFIL